MDKIRQIDNLDNEIRVLLASNEQCAREADELRKAVTEMEDQLRCGEVELNDALMRDNLARTKLIIFQTRFIANLSTVVNNTTSGVTLNYDTFDDYVGMLTELFARPHENGRVIEQIKDALRSFNV